MKLGVEGFSSEYFFGANGSQRWLRHPLRAIRNGVTKLCRIDAVGATAAHEEGVCTVGALDGDSGETAERDETSGGLVRSTAEGVKDGLILCRGQLLPSGGNGEV